MLGRLAAGWTLAVNNVDTNWRPIRDFVIGLEDYFESPAPGSNLYVTFGGHDGYAMHFDDEGVFFAQISGSKHWRVWAAFVESPLPFEGNKFPDSEAEIAMWKRQPLLVNTTLRPVPAAAKEVVRTANARSHDSHNVWPMPGSRRLEHGREGQTRGRSRCCLC